MRLSKHPSYIIRGVQQFAACPPSEGFYLFDPDGCNMPERGWQLAGSPGRRSPHVVVLALIGIGGIAIFAPLRARAAACCLSATSFGVARLLAWEDAAFGFQIGHARILGEWASNAKLRLNPEGLSLVEPWAIVRLHERVQIQGWVPLLVNDRWFHGQRQLGGGLSDVGAAARFEIASIGEFQGLLPSR